MNYILHKDLQKEFNKAIKYHQQGNLAIAKRMYIDIIKENQDFYEAYNNLGVILKSEGNFNEAMLMYNKAIKLNKFYSDAYNNIGNLLVLEDRHEDSIYYYKKTIDIDSSHYGAYLSLSDVYIHLGYLDDAEYFIREVIRLNPDSYIAYNNLGNVLKNKGLITKAIESFKKSLELNSNCELTYHNYANLLSDLGEKDKAKDLLTKAIYIKPDFADAHRGLSNLIKFKENDKYLEEINLLLNITKNDKDRGYLNFALSKAYEDIGDVNRCFNYLEAGNKIFKNIYNYKHEQYLKIADMIKSFFNNKLSLNNKIVNHGKRMIFIVGMPRSGTSLVEQILSTHSLVYGAGELDFMRKEVNKILLKIQDNKSIDTNNISDLKINYIKSLDNMDILESIVVDKMPHNFLYIGFILQAFPDAKIIHTKRDAMAICWSMYKNFFPSKALAFSFDMKDLASFYHLYDDMMKFWNELYPDKIYNLEYEKLTEYQEEETRKLLEYCELPWEDACLEFHKTKRYVGTASNQQVRKGMYKGSSEAWRKYEKHLQPLIEELKKPLDVDEFLPKK